MPSASEFIESNCMKYYGTIHDMQLIDELKLIGVRLTNQFCFFVLDRKKYKENKEKAHAAIIYLQEEWDFGTLTNP